MLALQDEWANDPTSLVDPGRRVVPGPVEGPVTSAIVGVSECVHLLAQYRSHHGRTQILKRPPPQGVQLKRRRPRRHHTRHLRIRHRPAALLSCPEKTSDVQGSD